MTEATLQGEFLVLDKAEHGEKFIRLILFHQHQGLLTGLIRTSGSRAIKHANAPDICDEATAILTKGQGNLYFIKDYQLIHRHSQLGMSYDRLQWAARLIRALRPNMNHIDEIENHYALLKNTLSSIAEKPLPEAAYCKCLYLFARSEGYAVGESWLRSLPLPVKQAALHILQSPLAEIVVSDENMKQVRQTLETFLRHHSDIILPN